MKKYIGCDAHARYSIFVSMDEQGVSLMDALYQSRKGVGFHLGKRLLTRAAQFQLRFGNRLLTRGAQFQLRFGNRLLTRAAQFQLRFGTRLLTRAAQFQ